MKEVILYGISLLYLIIIQCIDGRSLDLMCGVLWIFWRFFHPSADHFSTVDHFSTRVVKFTKAPMKILPTVLLCSTGTTGGAAGRRTIQCWSTIQSIARARWKIRTALGYLFSKYIKYIHSWLNVLKTMRFRPHNNPRRFHQLFWKFTKASWSG